MSPGRLYLSNKEYRDLFEKQGCKCALCPNEAGPFEADHETPNYYKPGKPDQIVCVPCHREKTREQQPEINRTKRLNGEFGSQYTRRQERKAKGLAPPLRGQGFPNKRTRKTRAEIMGEHHG